MSGVELRPLQIRSRLGRKDWLAPEGFGVGGWVFLNRHETGQVLVTCRYDLSPAWVHASIAFRDRMPTYEELASVHWAVFGNHYAYQVFAPEEQHVTFHNHALHLWGRVDGEPVLPEFSVEIAPGQRMI